LGELETSTYILQIIIEMMTAHSSRIPCTKSYMTHEQTPSCRTFVSSFEAEVLLPWPTKYIQQWIENSTIQGTTEGIPTPSVALHPRHTNILHMTTPEDKPMHC